MPDWGDERDVLITCAKGLAPYLEEELSSLGFVAESKHETGVIIRCSWFEAARLNLRLRTAFNVLLLLSEFRCRTADELYGGVGYIPWEELLAPDGYVSVVARADTKAIKDWKYAALKTKDAIVDRMMAKCGQRPDSGPERDHVVVNLYWKDERAWLYLNMSGKKLADRGYRRIPHRAPMQETLAAGVLLAAGYSGGSTLVNPMCGSGTLAIEAALIASGRPIGLLRSNFGFMHAGGFQPDWWRGERIAAKKCRSKRKPSRIIATDIDERAVVAARKNAETAGVGHLIEFGVCDFADSEIPENGGLVLLNPEYGERLGDVRELEETYKRIGDFFKQRCSGYTGYVFTGNLDLAKKIGLRASRRIVFFNAQIECRLLKYEMYEGTRRKLKPE